MHLGWLDIAFIGLVILCVVWEHDKRENRIRDKLSNIESDQQALDHRLKAIEHDMACVFKALPAEEETIEEQWLAENYKPLA